MRDVKIETAIRSQLYHGRYKYAVRCWIRDASVLRRLDHDQIDDIIDWRNSRPRRGFEVERITDEQGDILHQLCDLLLGLPGDWHKTCYIDHLHLYTNDEAHVTALAKSPLIAHAWVWQAQVDLPRDRLLRILPDWRFRTYLRERVLSTELTELLRNFVTSRADHAMASRSLSRSLMTTTWGCYVRHHHYIDHDDEQLPMLLSLTCPDLIRCTMPIDAK